MYDDLRLRLNQHSSALQSRATELSLAGQDGDIAAIMSGVAVALEALLVLDDEQKAPRSGPSEE